MLRIGDSFYYLDTDALEMAVDLVKKDNVEVGDTTPESEYDTEIIYTYDDKDALIQKSVIVRRGVGGEKYSTIKYNILFDAINTLLNIQNFDSKMNSGDDLVEILSPGEIVAFNTLTKYKILKQI